MALPLMAARGRGGQKSSMSRFFVGFLSLPRSRQDPYRLLSLSQQRHRDLGAKRGMRCGFVMDPGS
jgi:hypothetical protein